MLLAIMLAMALPDTGQCVGFTAAAAADQGAKGGPWFTNDDYPRAARRAHQEGVVAFTLDIDPRGCPAACHITQSSGYQSLDDATCPILMRRARFRPAVDSAGNPIAASWSNKFRWKLD